MRARVALAITCMLSAPAMARAEETPPVRHLTVREARALLGAPRAVASAPASPSTPPPDPFADAPAFWQALNAWRRPR